MPELSDANVFGTPAAAPTLPKEMSDAEVFAPPKEMSDSEVFGAPSGPGLVRSGLGQVGGLATSIAGETPESRQFESALSGVMEGGMSPDQAAQMAPVPPTQPEHGGFARGFMTTMSKENPAAAADFLEGFSNDAPEAYKGSLMSAAQKVRDFSKDITPKGYERLANSMYDIRGLGDAWNWLTETAGSMVASTVPPLVTGGAGALVGGVVGGPTGAVVGGTIGAGSASYIQNYGEVYNALKDAGLDAKVAHNYAKYGTIPIAALDTGSLEFLVSRFGGVQAAKRALIDSFVKRVKSVVKSAAETGGVEAGTEAAQEAIKDAVVSVSPADKPFLTTENLKGILESGVAGLVGGVTMGGPAGVFHAPAPSAPGPTETAMGAAGAGIVAPPEAPTPPAPVPPPGPPPGPAQGSLPLGPPTAQLRLPLGVPTTPPAQLAQKLASMIEPISNAPMGPSLNPLIDRGRSISEAAQSPLIAQGPLETNPQRVEIPPGAIDTIAARNAGIAEPGERVAVPAIEYNGMLFDGALHMEAVGNAMQKLGVSEDQIIDSPTFREGFITTEGRFISREEAAHIADRHNQYESYFGSQPEGRLFAENLKTFEDPRMYTKAFAAISRSQEARGLKGGPAIDEMAKNFAVAMKAKKAVVMAQAGPTSLSPSVAAPTVTAAPKPSHGQQTQITKALKEAATQNLPIPNITVGKSVTPPGRPTVNTIHSTTVGQLLPTLSPFAHFGEKTIHRVVAEALVKRLTAIVPTMPIHIVLPEEMNKLSQTAEGLYISSPQSLELPIAHQGPIFVNTTTFGQANRFSEVVMHETVHAATSNILRGSQVARDLVKSVEAALIVHMKGVPQNLLQLTDDKRLQLHRQGIIPYDLINEREFLTGLFTRPGFQDLLQSTPAPPTLIKVLGLREERGKIQKVWDAAIEVIRRVIGLEPRSPEVVSLLEAAVRTGVDVMNMQTRERQTMQAKFNQIDPMLKAEPRQEATRGAYEMLKGLRNHIEPGLEADEMARQVGYADKMNWFYQMMIHAFQLGELNPHLAPLQRILEKARFASTEEARINDAALRVMKDWVNIGRGMGQKLTNLIDDITNMVYRTPSEIQRGIGRKPTQAEFNTLVRRHGVNQAGLDVLTKINTLFSKFLDLSSDLARAEALKLTDPQAQIAALQAIQQNVTNLKSVPYFPFMRYGRYVVLVRNQAGRVIHREHFERRGFRSAAYFQEQAAKRLEQAFPAPQYKVETDVLSESSKPMIGMPGMMLNLMQQKLNLSPVQLKALEQLRYEVSPAQSYKHRMQNKSYTAGYSQDFQRSFAQYFFHGAKWYVKTKYADDMRANIQEIRDTRMASLTPRKRAEIANFMEDWLQKGFLDPTQDFIAFKSGLVFYTLAYVPVSAVVNMSQTPMVTLPYLGAKFGDVRASAALLKAIGTGRNYYRKGGLSSMTSAEAKALDYAIRTGRLEQTLATELAAWAQGSNLGVGYGGTAIARTLHGIVEKGMWMFSVAEKWNRRIAFAAARELALSQPNNKFVKDVLTRYHDELAKMMAEGFPQHEAEAILVASHIVDQTQFMAGPDSRPKFMRGKLGSIFLYKRFIQGLMFLTLNNKRDFAPRFMVVAMAMAGLSGVPGYEDIGEIARVLGWWLFGKDFSVDREIRRLMKAMGAEDGAADQILHGSARMGFGVPWLLNLLTSAAGQSPTVNAKRGYPSGPDISKSIGAGPILPVELGKLLGPPINDPDKMFGEQAARAGGVMGQLAYNFYRAIESKDPGDFKRWELMMPRFAKDLSQAYRAYSTGKLAGKNDTAIIQFDTRDPEHLGELVGMMGGFQPRRLTAKYEELRNQSEEIKFYNTNRSMLLEQWTTAIRGGNPDEKERMRVATQEFNASLPTAARGFALTSDTIQRSVMQRLKSQQLMEAGFAVQKGQIPLIQEMQGLFPENTVDVRRR